MPNSCIVARTYFSGVPKFPRMKETIKITPGKTQYLGSKKTSLKTQPPRPQNLKKLVVFLFENVTFTLLQHCTLCTASRAAANHVDGFTAVNHN